jgi:hypothetical protein
MTGGRRFLFKSSNVEALMKIPSWKLCLVGVLVWLALLSRTAIAAVPEEDQGGPGDRLRHLEQRVNELAERQEQMMRRLSALPEGPGRSISPNGIRPEAPMPGFQPNPEFTRPPWARMGMPRPTPPGAHQKLQDLVGLLILAGVICNILLAVWIFTDIRKRGEGSGIFIALALIAGIPTAIIYAVVRLGDKKTAP